MARLSHEQRNLTVTSILTVTLTITLGDVAYLSHVQILAPNPKPNWTIPIAVTLSLPVNLLVTLPVTLPIIILTAIRLALSLTATEAVSVSITERMLVIKHLKSRP